MVRWQPKKTYIDIEDVVQPYTQRKSISFAEKHPELALEWCYKKNCGWGPEDFLHASTVKAWWTCPKCNRIYKAKLCQRSASKSGCTYCSSRLVCDDNSFAVNFPELAKQWHPSKNGKKKASQFTFASGEEVWWLCPKGVDHIWKKAISARTCKEAIGSKTLGCPFCHGLKQSVTNSLGALFPHLRAEWHPTRNKELTPDGVSAHSSKRVWWVCKEGHEWRQVPSHRVNGVGCPFCTGRKVAAARSLHFLHPELTTEWHPSKNGLKAPRHVLSSSKKLVWWQCKKNHEWQVSPYERTVKGYGCPYCSGRRTCLETSLESLFPKQAAELHPTLNGDLRASELSPGSHDKVWWLCQNGEDHVWEQSPKSRMRTGKCPFCSGKKVSITNSLKSMFPKIAEEWDQSKNDGLEPDQFTWGSGKMIWWRCRKNEQHVWQSRICQRTHDKQTCPECRKK